MALSILAFLLFFFCVLLFKAVRALPLYELRRRAKLGDKGLQSIYKSASYGLTLDVFLWLASASFLSWSLVLAFKSSALATVSIVFLAVFVTVFIKPAPEPAGLAWLLAKLAARPVTIAAGLLHPLVSIFSKEPNPSKKPPPPVFEKQDLINLVKSQKDLPGNRISVKDLHMVEAALSFSGKAVNEVMVAGTKQCFVSGNEPIGPLLMDELHSRGRFAYLVTKGPVKKQGSRPIGTVFLRDLIGHRVGGHVKDVAHETVYYINEAQPIADALDAMLKTQFPILAVINNFEEIAGVISLEDITKQLLPNAVGSDFENFANPKVVASWQYQKSTSDGKHRVPSEKSDN